MRARRIAVADDMDARSGLKLGDLAESIGTQLYYAQRASSINLAARLTSVGFGSRNVTLLTLIHMNPGAPQGRIAEAVNLDRSTIVPIIDKLERDGFVERRPADHDARSKGLWLTRKGARIVDRVKNIQTAHETNLLSGFSQSQKKLLHHFLRRMTDNATLSDPHELS